MSEDEELEALVQEQQKVSALARQHEGRRTEILAVALFVVCAASFAVAVGVVVGPAIASALGVRS